MKYISIKRNRLKILNASVPLGLLLVGFLVFACEKTSPDAFQEEHYHKFFGNAYEDVAADMLSYDGYHYLLGTYEKSSGDSTGILVVKTDSYGNRIWETHISKSHNLVAGSIITASNNTQLALVGTCETDDSLYYQDMFFALLDLDGDTLVTHTYPLEQNESGAVLGQFADERFVLVGLHETEDASAQYKFALILDDQGNYVKNSRLQDGTSPQEIHSIVYDSVQDNFIVLGVEPGFVGTASTFVVDGNAGFTNHFNYPIDGAFTGAVFTEDQELYVSGNQSESSGSYDDIFVAKINPYLDEIVWITALENSFNDQCGKLTITGSELFVSGSIQTNLSDYNIFAASLSLNGDVLETADFGSTNNEYGVYGIKEEQNYLLLGTAYRDDNSLLTLLKTSLVD